MFFNQKKGNLPNCIIIGAQKCATSSLHYYMSLHPQIIASRHKELNYFNEELCWNKGLDWYRSHFQGIGLIYSESSPAYTNYPLYKGVAERMHKVIPRAKLIYIVRHPVERLVSHYLDKVKGGQEHQPLAAALSDFKNCRYIWFSKYYMQLEQYLRYYPRESFLVLTAEKLKTERLATLRKIFDFLGVKNSFYSRGFEQLKNVSEYKLKTRRPRRFVRYLANGPKKKSMINRLLYMAIPTAVKVKAFATTVKGERVPRPVADEELRERIIDYLRDDIEKLKDFTGYDFNEWNIGCCADKGFHST